MVKKPAKVALDQLLIDRRVLDTLQSARARIMAGEVIVNEQRVDKPGTKFSSDVTIRLRGHEHPFVSRGGLKLEHALKLWPTAVSGAVCMDVGASTGGFSEVLLNFGAKKVYAIDVGYGQLAHKLRIDERVVNLERTHILDLDPSILSEPVSVVVIDVSFISLEKILPRVVELAAKNAAIYALVKPQFEVSRDNIGPGGIVVDPLARQAAVDKVVSFAVHLGLQVRGVEASPILGAKGNMEFLLALQT
jgi:23S rRNA (cytidine1920-2'-O)/16S rRNA (cytidine1409-2'-O)-methyltransferase